MNLIRSQFAIQDKNSTDLENEKDFYIRLAFSGIDKENLTEGMSKFKKWIESRRN